MRINSCHYINNSKVLHTQTRGCSDMWCENTGLVLKWWFLLTTPWKIPLRLKRQGWSLSTGSKPRWCVRLSITRKDVRRSHQTRKVWSKVKLPNKSKVLYIWEHGTVLDFTLVLCRSTKLKLGSWLPCFHFQHLQMYCPIEMYSIFFKAKK